MSNNFFVNDYEQLRQTLMTIFIYGCYDRTQLQKRMLERGYKYSDRTCDTLLQCIRYFWKDTENQTRFPCGRKIHYFPAGRYSVNENILWRIYHIKSFLERDANLFFFINSAIQHLTKDSSDAFTYDNIIRQMYDDTKIIELFDYKEKQKIRREILKLKEWGFIESDNPKTPKTKAVENIFEKISKKDLLFIYELLDLYRDILPLSTLGYSLQLNIKDYLVYEEGFSLPSHDNIFIHKDMFSQNILNDEILFQIYIAIEENKYISMDYDNRHTGKRLIQKFLPQKIIIDFMYGRQYVLGTLNDNPIMYRLDKISKVKLSIKQHQKPIASDINLQGVWSSSCRLQDSTTVIVDFIFPESKAGGLIKKLNSQRRGGIVEPISDTHVVYTVNVNDPNEMLPWIRSWAPFAQVISSSKHNLQEKIYSTWKDLLNTYIHQKFERPLKTIKNKQHEYFDYKTTDKDVKEFKNPPSLFLEYRNIYYYAIRSILHLISPKQHDRTKKKIKSSELSKYIVDYAGIDYTADKYLTNISKSNPAPKTLALFKKSSDDSLRYAYSRKPPSIMPGKLEKRYLLTLLQEPEIQYFLGDSTIYMLKTLLNKERPFAWETTIIERGIGIKPNIETTNNLWNNILIIMEAIRNKKSLTYRNNTQYGEKRGIMKPYKIMYSSQAKHFQVITAASSAQDEEIRLVLMNIKQLSDLTETDNNSIDVEKLLNEKKEPAIHIIIRQYIGRNDIERAFMLFSNYERTSWYDEIKDEYHIELQYYSFQYESEILPRILSLGAAAEIVTPQNIRKDVIDIIKKAINEQV